jgi:DNA (cytosine-5)-methyltransferase 1
MRRTFKVASLFAGCGGMDLGVSGGFSFNGMDYEALPAEIVHASDFDPRVVDIYNLNFDHRADVVDIRNLSSTNLPKVDIVLGGFPCQSFSVVAQNPKRLGYKDEKGMLFFEMKRIVQEKQPLVFIAENVKGILSANKGEALPLIIQEFEEAGYHVTYKLLNAADFGVPQKRERVFIVGFKSKEHAASFDFPSPTTSSERVPIKGFLQDSEEIDSSFYFSERAVEGMKNTKHSKSMNKGRAQDISGPSNTLGAHLAKVSLNSTDPVLKLDDRYRMFTPREVARLQSFPEEFHLAGPRGHNYIALGNAVPPVLMWHVARSVVRALTAQN